MAELSSYKATDWAIEGPGFGSYYSQEILLFYNASGPVLGPTQLHIKFIKRLK
jgi:hypothetical protein